MRTGSSCEPIGGRISECYQLVKVTVKFMSMVRLRAGVGKVEFLTQKDALGDIVKEIAKKYDVRDLILTNDGKVRPWSEC